MPADSRDMPPVRLLPAADLARLALAAPLLDRAARLARWAAPSVAVDAAGELVEDALLRAAADLGVEAAPDGLADTADAWALAVFAEFVDIDIDLDTADDDAGDPGAPAGTATPGAGLRVVESGAPSDVLELWLSGFDSLVTEAACAGLADLPGDDGDGDGAPPPAWDPAEEADFLDGALANLYLLTALEESAARREAAPGAPAPDAQAVPLPVLAASMILPDDMDVPTDAVLEEVSEAMMRLDEQFRLLAGTGAVEYRPVDESLIEEGDEEDRDGALPPPAPGGDLDAEEVSRYGMVRLTPLGVLGVRERLREAGIPAPAVGDLAGADAGTVLAALGAYPADAASEEADRWLGGRDAVTAAAELLAAARGDTPGAPARRLTCQQILSRLDGAAEPAVRAVLDDPHLGGLARVWLAERNARDVPPPDEAMVFWLTLDTLAAQLDLDDDAELLGALVRDLVARHEGFFDRAWRVRHPDAADVLDAIGRLHPDRAVAKEARKAAFKARSAATG